VVSGRRVDLKVIPGGATRQTPGAPSAPPRSPRRLFGPNADPPAPVPGPYESGLRPVDLLILVYFAVTACLIVALRSTDRAWLALAMTHVLAAIVLMRLGTIEPPRNVVWRVIRDLYPLALLAILYAEYGWLTRLTGVAPHDALIAGLEERLFGSQPSRELRMWFPYPWLSQYVHGAYFLYYAVIGIVPITLYVQRRWAAFHESMTTILLSFLSCGLFFITFPVAGPYHHFGVPDLGNLGGGMAAIAHGVVERGSSVGTAFPSSHTAIAFAVWLVALRLTPRIAWLLVLVVPALAVGTIFGGFHYALDTLAGAAWGIVVGLVGPRLHAFIAQRLPRARSGPKVAPADPIGRTGRGA
jgi:membrane-associated phospholipid phosphatase